MRYVVLARRKSAPHLPREEEAREALAEVGEDEEASYGHCRHRAEGAEQRLILLGEHHRGLRSSPHAHERSCPRHSDEEARS